MPKNNTGSTANKQSSTGNKSTSNQQNHNSNSSLGKKNDNPKPNKVDMRGIQTKGIKP
jgi:hypothetical protein